MTNLLQLLIALRAGGLLRMTSDGTHIYAYFKESPVPPELKAGIVRYKSVLLQRLKRPYQFEDEILAKGVFVV